jgi:hypothetical protein
VIPTEADGPVDESAPGEHEPDRALQALLDDQRRTDAAGRRRRGRALAEQAGESTTLAGVLRDLGEQGATVTFGGPAVTGTVIGLGSDFVAVSVGHRAEVLVPLAAVDVVRPGPQAPRTWGDRVPADGRPLAAVLGDLAAQRARVCIRTRGGAEVSGTLVGAGIDVVTVVRPDDGAVYVAIAALGQVTIG